ncbi:MAG: hypothetical protein K2P99_03125 [Burkholderiales bacterium]|nr:hypothetical protein [Burkholderiales bacterium]
MRLIILLLIVVVMFSTTFAVGLADYIPSFLIANQNNSKSSHNHQINTSMVGVNNYQSVTGDNTESNNFCKRSRVYSVFCEQKNESSLGMGRISTDIESPAKFLKPKINTDPNQTSFQSQDLRSALNKYNSSYMLNITPKDNMSVGLGMTNTGLNQLQFNMKY